VELCRIVQQPHCIDVLKSFHIPNQKLNDTLGTFLTLNNKVFTFFMLFLIIALLGCQSRISRTAVNIITNERTWMVNKADGNSSNYSPLDQINVSNVSRLRLAWKFTIDDLPETAQPGNSECIPIIIDGIMYATSAKQQVYALDATTGKQLWTFDPFNGGQGMGILSRGVTYYEKGKDRRILVTGGQYLFALDCTTGKAIASFGDKGKVDMNVGLRDDPKEISSVLPLLVLCIMTL
jgi:glucose dehydrogenase